MSNINAYQDFVVSVTSETSLDLETLITRLRELHAQANISALLTGAIGLSSEGGEFSEIVKKCVFQGKPLDSDVQFHLKRELGDALFYWVLSAHALGLDPESVMQENIRKLQARYPNGFNVARSEVRAAGDL